MLKVFFVLNSMEYCRWVSRKQLPVSLAIDRGMQVRI